MFVRLLESTVINFDVNKEIKVFPRKVVMLVCRRDISLLLQDEHIIVLCCYFSCWLWNVFFVSLWKVPAFGRGRTIVVLQDKRLWIVSKCQMFLMFVLLIWTMICFAFFMARMTGAGWCYRSGTLSTLFGNTS